MTAVMGRRILAWVIDLVLFLAVVVGVFAALAEYEDIPPGFALDACEVLALQDSDAATGCVVVGNRAYITSTSDNAVQTTASIGYLAFFVVLQGVTGASPGKLLTGLRVVDEDGQRPGVGRSFVRTLLWIVDGAPWFLPLVGFVVGLTSTGHRRVGDLAAKTYVVSARDAGAPVSTGEVTPTGSSGAPPQPWQSSPPPSGAPWSPMPATSRDRTDAAPPDAARPASIAIDGAGGDRVTDLPPIPSTDDLVPDVSGTADRAPDLTAGPPTADTSADVATPHLEADPAWSAVPETPNEDFATTDDASPTAGPAPFVAPGSEPELPEAPAAAEPAPAPMPPPQWDVARNTYIQWDPARQLWLQWDTVANRWKLIDS
jgi:uncharacterized RDD family membrane protein YckC